MFQLEGIDGRPALRVRYANGSLRLVDLENGSLINGIPPGQAAAVARPYFEPGFPTRPPELAQTIAYDEWTVQGAHHADRPLYRFALHDGQSTEIYVSSRDGSAIQMTTAPSAVLELARLRASLDIFPLPEIASGRLDANSGMDVDTGLLSGHHRHRSRHRSDPARRQRTRGSLIGVSTIGITYWA